MDAATPRFRLFDGRRGGGGGGGGGGGIIDHEEGGATQTLPRRRRMVTSMSVARARRRNRRRPGTRRGLALFLLSLPGATGSRRRVALLLLLAACAAGGLVSARLLAWAAAAVSPSSSRSSSPPKSPRHHHASSGTAAAAAESGDEAGRPRGQTRRRRVSLGPDAIPSVVLIERRPAGGARRSSSLDAGAEEGRETASAEGRGGGLVDQPRRRCRNTAQGAVLLADSEGRVCRRSEVDDVHRPGCCAARPPPRESYVDRGIAGSHVAAAASAASAGTTKVQTGRVLEPAALPLLTHGGTATAATAVAAAAAAENQPRGDVIGGVGFPPEQALSAPFSCWSCDEGGEGADNGGGGGGGDGAYYSSCCRSYEFCVSCCQAPSREQEREAIREAAARSGHPVYRELGLIKGGAAAAAADLLRKKSANQLRGVEGGGAAAAAAEEEEHQARGAREAAFAHCAFRCRTYSGSVAHENSYRGPLKHCFGRFRPPVIAPGVLTAGAQGQALPAGRGDEVARSNGGGQEAPPLQLDPFLASLRGA